MALAAAALHACGTTVTLAAEAAAVHVMHVDGLGGTTGCLQFSMH